MAALLPSPVTMSSLNCTALAVTSLQIRWQADLAGTQGVATCIGTFQPYDPEANQVARAYDSVQLKDLFGACAALSAAGRPQLQAAFDALIAAALDLHVNGVPEAAKDYVILRKGF